MDCREAHAFLEPYADGELGVGEVAGVEAHLAACPGCRELLAQLRRFHQLLRRQPRETAPDELRRRVGRALRRQTVGQAARPLLAGAIAAGLLLVVAAGAGLRGLGPWRSPAAPPLVAELVDKHIAYSRVDSPVEFASAEGPAVSDWFRQRLGLAVTVPDYTPGGIRLLGGRIADAGGRDAAYLLYEKGRTLMSVFVVPGSRLSVRGARTLAYRGGEYYSTQVESYRAVFWSERGTTFGLVSALDEAALLECADRLRREAAGQAGA